MRSELPKVKLLQVFDAVVRHGGFAPAQQELGLSLSAISTYMTQLESDLGMVLCHRGRGGFGLTSKGELYHAECVRVLNDLDGLKRYAQVLQGELHGRVTIGFIDSVVTDPALPLAATIGVFSAAYPGVYLDLTTRRPHDLQTGVLRDEIDVAIGVFAKPMPGLVTTALHREQHWLYCSDAHPLYAMKRISLEQITSQRIVTRGYWDGTELVQEGFAHPSATVENMEAQLILILSGAYIGYLPEHFAQEWLDRKRLRPLRPAVFGHQARFAAIHRRGRRREPLVQTFLECLLTRLDS
ncbi:MAG: LysR family transcriptional regulator [Gordonia sp. (in: high G+C Gram-positive bacteria)]